MRLTNAIVLVVAIAALVAGCSQSGGPRAGAGGAAQVSLEGKSYEVRDVSLTFEPGEDAYFRLEGEPVVSPDKDCVYGMVGGLNLYGDLPGSVRKAADFAGKRLKVDFSGDGDDANFCFAGMGGIAGAEDAWVTIETVDGDRVEFSMTGTFTIFDDNGDGPVKEARASGTAAVRRESAAVASAE